MSIIYQIPSETVVTDGRTDGRTDEWTDRRTDGRTDGRTNGRTDERTNGRMDERTTGLRQLDLRNLLIKEWKKTDKMPPNWKLKI